MREKEGFSQKVSWTTLSIFDEDESCEDGWGEKRGGGKSRTTCWYPLDDTCSESDLKEIYATIAKTRGFSLRVTRVGKSFWESFLLRVRFISRPQIEKISYTRVSHIHVLFLSSTRFFYYDVKWPLEQPLLQCMLLRCTYVGDGMYNIIFEKGWFHGIVSTNLCLIFEYKIKAFICNGLY